MKNTTKNTTGLLKVYTEVLAKWPVRLDLSTRQSYPTAAEKDGGRPFAGGWVRSLTRLASTTDEQSAEEIGRK